jgi:hypothetical protein
VRVLKQPNAQRVPRIAEGLELRQRWVVMIKREVLLELIAAAELTPPQSGHRLANLIHTSRPREAPPEHWPEAAVRLVREGLY